MFKIKIIIFWKYSQREISYCSDLGTLFGPRTLHYLHTHTQGRYVHRPKVPTSTVLFIKYNFLSCCASLPRCCLKISMPISFLMSHVHRFFLFWWISSNSEFKGKESGTENVKSTASCCMLCFHFLTELLQGNEADIMIKFFKGTDFFVLVFSKKSFEEPSICEFVQKKVLFLKLS